MTTFDVETNCDIDAPDSVLPLVANLPAALLRLGFKFMPKGRGESVYRLHIPLFGGCFTLKDGPVKEVLVDVSHVSTGSPIPVHVRCGEATLRRQRDKLIADFYEAIGGQWFHWPMGTDDNLRLFEHLVRSLKFLLTAASLPVCKDKTPEDALIMWTSILRPPHLITGIRTGRMTATTPNLNSVPGADSFFIGYKGHSFGGPMLVGPELAEVAHVDKPTAENLLEVYMRNYPEGACLANRLKEECEKIYGKPTHIETLGQAVAAYGVDDVYHRRVQTETEPSKIDQALLEAIEEVYEEVGSRRNQRHYDHKGNKRRTKW